MVFEAVRHWDLQGSMGRRGSCSKPGSSRHGQISDRKKNQGRRGAVRVL